MLKEKIAQLLLLGFKGDQLSDDFIKTMTEYSIGGVILFADNIKNPAQLRKLTQELKHHNVSTLPLFISIDYEGGTVLRLTQEQGFPATLTAAEVGQSSLSIAKQCAKQMAMTLKQFGFNLNFAPVVDVATNPMNPIISKRQRSFSADPQKVADYAALYMQAFQQQGILPVLKHFPGHGSSSGDTHLGLVDVTETWQVTELIPYQKLLSHYNDVMVMTAHVVHQGFDSYPASLSKVFTTQVLREQLHFDGVVITDDLQMRAITDQYGFTEALRLAINAGADMLLLGNQLQTAPPANEIIESIYDDVQRGFIAEARIEEAYQRICCAKKQFR